MAGMSVTVCLPAEAEGDVEAALDAALAPFDLNADNPPDRGMWDRWRIAGGSDGHGFAVAEGHFDDPRLLHDTSGRDGTALPNVPGVCAGGARALLDFGDPRATAERARAASWDLWHELSAVHPPALPLADFLRRAEADPQTFPDDPYGDAMFAAYREQPLIRAYLDHPFSLGQGFLGYPHPSEHPVIGFRGDRADYLRRHRPAADPVRQEDVLTPDGWWIEPNGAAVHGSCDPLDCGHTAPPVGPDTERYLAGLPGDTVLVRLRGHC